MRCPVLEMLARERTNKRKTLKIKHLQTLNSVFVKI